MSAIWETFLFESDSLVFPRWVRISTYFENVGIFFLVKKSSTMRSILLSPNHSASKQRRQFIHFSGKKKVIQMFISIKVRKSLNKFTSNLSRRSVSGI